MLHSAKRCSDEAGEHGRQKYSTNDEGFSIKSVHGYTFSFFFSVGWSVRQLPAAVLPVVIVLVLVAVLLRARW